MGKVFVCVDVLVSLTVLVMAMDSDGYQIMYTERVDKQKRGV